MLGGSGAFLGGSSGDILKKLKILSSMQTIVLRGCLSKFYPLKLKVKGLTGAREFHRIRLGRTKSEYYLGP
jgi:hypothetical protein